MGMASIQKTRGERVKNAMILIKITKGALCEELRRDYNSKLLFTLPKHR